MLFAATFSVLLSSAVVFASPQGGYGYGAPPPDTTTAAPSVPTAPPSTANQINVNVAPGNFTFSPANIIAPNNGTQITFFFPNNGIDHSVTQSSFENPCTYLAATANNSAGFDSGLTNSKQFTITITDPSQPIWFHCKQASAGSHCGMGMVGSINAPADGDRTFAAFQAAAMKLGASAPAEQDHGAVTGGFNAIATAAPAAGSTGSTSSGSKIATSFGAVLLCVAVASAVLV